MKELACNGCAFGMHEVRQALERWNDRVVPVADDTRARRKRRVDRRRAEALNEAGTSACLSEVVFDVALAKRTPVREEGIV